MTVWDQWDQNREEAKKFDAGAQVVAMQTLVNDIGITFDNPHLSDDQKTTYAEKAREGLSTAFEGAYGLEWGSVSGWRKEAMLGSIGVRETREIREIADTVENPADLAGIIADQSSKALEASQRAVIGEARFGDTAGIRSKLTELVDANQYVGFTAPDAADKLTPRELGQLAATLYAGPSQQELRRIAAQTDALKYLG